MWRRVQLDVHLDHPPPSVYRYLADPASWPEFAPAVDFRRRVDDGPPQVGSRWSAVDRIGPFRIRFTDVLETLEHDRRVVWHSTSPWNSRVEYLCTPDAGGTRIRADYEGDVAGWLRVVALLPTFVLARILLRDFRGLDRLLNRQDLEPAEPVLRRGTTRRRPGSAVQLGRTAG